MLTGSLSRTFVQASVLLQACCVTSDKSLSLSEQLFIGL